MFFFQSITIQDGIMCDENCACQEHMRRMQIVFHKMLLAISVLNNFSFTFYYRATECPRGTNLAIWAFICKEKGTHDYNISSVKYTK